MNFEVSNLLLSCRERPFAGWVAIDEFEDLFSRLDGCQIMTPLSRRRLPYLLERARNKALGGYIPVRNSSLKGDLLLVVARTPGNLHIVDSLGEARKQFRHTAGFVIDSFFTEGYGTSTKHFDHIFSTTEEGAEAIHKRFGISSSVLRQGFDCLNCSSIEEARCIDIIAFGRQPPSYHRAFQAKFHQLHCPLLYLHSPIGTLSGAAVWDERPMMLKLLQRSKISVAFNLGIEPGRVRPRASGFVTSRWFESLASGCVVAGKRPIGPMAEEMFSWLDSTIDLPDDFQDASEIVADLASDSARLGTIRPRNVIEMCRRHDWRYRIRDIYRHFSLKLPEPLVEELKALGQLTERFQTQIANSKQVRADKLPQQEPLDRIGLPAEERKRL